MSSSSALMIGVFLSLSGVNSLARRDEYMREIDSAESLAGYLGTIENGQSFGSLAGDKGVGTFGGSQDHTAILCCRKESFSQYSYCPVRLERGVAPPAGYSMAVAACGVVAEKTGQAMVKYNHASQRASAVAAAWNQAAGRRDGHIAAALRAAGDGGPERIREILTALPGGGQFTQEELLSRFDQFYADSEEIIPAAGDALLAGDVREFARQAARSQELAETLLGNQIAETEFLARSAGDCGAVAASAFGAGFGGAVWAMVPQAREDQALAAWREAYRGAYPAAAGYASFFLTRAGPAAFELF